MKTRARELFLTVVLFLILLGLALLTWALAGTTP